MGRRLLVGVLALAGVLPIVTTANTASAATSKVSRTATCVKVVVKNVKVTNASIGACESSSIKVTHPCPEGSTAVLAVVHTRSYMLRVGRKPVRLPKQFGLVAVSQACGTPAAIRTAPTTTSTTAPPPTTTSTTAPPPPPPTTTLPPPPPTTAAPASCYPLTDGGNCYEPGEYCRDSDHGASGRAGDGEAITCEDNDGWRWEPT